MEKHRDVLGDFVDRPRPIDTRYCEDGPFDREGDLPPFQNVWLKANGVLPDDPVLQVCVLTYASDMTLLDTSLLPHGESLVDGDIFMASLDHAMWFHRPFRADEWLLFAQDTPSSSSGRGLGRGLVFDESGQLVASAVQEGVVRRNR
jgi:acyl-CoA thioesterase-2